MGKRLVPELRFPEFSGKWEEKELGELGNFGKTYSYPRCDEGIGEYHHIHYGDIHSKFNGTINSDTDIPSIMINKKHELLNNGDIVIADASEDYEDLGKTIVINDTSERKIVSGSHTFKFTPNKNLNSIFYMNYSQSDLYKRFTRINGTGVSVLGLSKKNLSNMKINIPSIEEQTKISNLFTLIDGKIEKQEEKVINLEEYKNGMMQKIFSQEIRFKDENGEDYPEWKDKNFNELPILISDGNYGEAYPSSNDFVKKGVMFFRSNNIIDNKINISDMRYITEEKHSKLLSGHLEFKDIIISTRGELGKLAMIPKKYEHNNINAQLCLLRVENSKIINQTYLFIFLSFSGIQKQIFQMATGTALKQFPKKNFTKLIISLPPIEEQIKIANFLSSIDLKIDKEEEKLDSLKDFKKGLMQKMFI